MAVTLSRVGGALTNTKTTLFTASGTVLAISMTFHNTDVATRNVKVYLHNGTSRRILSIDLESGTTIIQPEKVVLQNGDLIEGEAATSSVVDYWLSLATVT